MNKNKGVGREFDGRYAVVEANGAFANWVAAQVVTPRGRVTVVFALSVVGRRVVTRGSGSERTVTLRGTRQKAVLPVAALKFETVKT